MLSRKEQLALAVRAEVDPRTVGHLLKGDRRVHPAIEAAIRRAASELGLALSPVPVAPARQSTPPLEGQHA